MEIKKQVVFRNIAGESMLIPVKGAVLDYNGIFSLTETGAFIWKCIEKGLSEENITDSILKEYDTDRDTASADVRAFIEKMQGFGIL